MIQARKGGQTLELIPFSRLTKDFPEFLSRDYHHWACLGTKTIEFRPLQHPWSASNRQWHLRFSPNGTTTLHNIADGSSLVDIHSPLFRSISCRLSPLESPRYLHVTLSGSSETRVQVELPRMRLSFFLNMNMQLESTNFHGQIIDDDQSAGTFFGLRNQLVLCAKDPIARSLPRSRSVLIPDGGVKFEEEGHHVSVIIWSNSRRVLFHRYMIDMDLGYLANDAGLTSRLYKVYLHALTSYCLPDPLTGRTGTEEALWILCEGATSSFGQIDKKQRQLLNLIGSLTPERTYRPLARNWMPFTEWLTIPSLSQHFGFSTASAAILNRAFELRIFRPSRSDTRDFIVYRKGTLLQRAAIRSQFYYPPDTPNFMAQICEKSALDDKAYIGRDSLGDWAQEGQNAAWAARLAYSKWGQPVYKPFNLLSLVESWSKLQDSPGDLTLAYSRHWLELDLLRNHWISLYNLCRHASVTSNKFRLASCLASATFSNKIPLNLLPVIIAFATNPDFSGLDPPGHSTFTMADGYKPTLKNTKGLISSHPRDLLNTPTAHLSQQDKESESQFAKRQNSYYKHHIVKHGHGFAQSMMDQWPSIDLQSFPDIYSSWFLTEECLRKVQNYFSSCRRNAELREHILQVERVLSSRLRSQGISFSRVTVPSIGRPVAITPLKYQLRELCIDSLMSQRPFLDSEDCVLPPEIAAGKQPKPPTDTSRLSILITELKCSLRPLNRLYGMELDESRNDLAKKSMFAPPKQLPRLELLDRSRQAYNSALTAKLHRLKLCLGPVTPTEHILHTCGVWPRITPRTVLQQLTLAARLRSRSSSMWQQTLIGYARMFVDYQRSQRLVVLAQSQRVEDFWKEIEATETDLSTDKLNPDWLLVQVCAENPEIWRLTNTFQD